MVDVAAARSRLEERLDDLDDQRRTLLGENAGANNEELSSYDQHPAESATHLSEEDREQALIEGIDAQRDEVRAALARVDEGTYGRCTDCGRELPAERLELRPEAGRCVDCQGKAEARS